MSDEFDIELAEWTAAVAKNRLDVDQGNAVSKQTKKKAKKQVIMPSTGVRISRWIRQAAPRSNRKKSQRMKINSMPEQVLKVI